MRILVFGLTGVAVILFLAQFFGKKGTRGHIVRGMLVAFLSLAVVVINTFDISLKRGLIWDVPFLTHTILGTLFFVSLGITSVIGYLLQNNKALIRKHGIMAKITGVFLFLTLFAAVFIRLFR